MAFFFDFFYFFILSQADYIFGFCIGIDSLEAKRVIYLVGWLRPS